MGSEIPLLCALEVFCSHVLLTMPSNTDSIEAAMASINIFFKSPAHLCSKPQFYRALRWRPHMTQRKLPKIYLLKPMSMGFILREILISGGFSDQQSYKKKTDCISLCVFLFIQCSVFFFLPRIRTALGSPIWLWGVN